MSHLVSGSVKVLDLQSLEKAVKSLGGTLVTKNTFTSYSGANNKCERAITLPGVSYEIGVIKDGSAYNLSWDTYGYDGSRHDGHKLVAQFGEGMSKLYQKYNREVVVKSAKAKGWMVRETSLSNGAIQMQLVRA